MICSLRRKVSIDRAAQLSRLFSICVALENRGEQRITRGDLAVLCNCAERTIGRDFEVLRASGVAVRHCKKRRTYFLQEALPFHALELSPGETLALAVALEGLQSREQTPYARHAKQISARLQANLPPVLRELFQSQSESLSLDGRARRRYAGAPFRVLEVAIARRQTLQMCYYTKSRDQTTTRLFDPYHLVERNGYYNAVGWCHARQEVRMFSLDSMRDLQPNGATFSIAAYFDLDRYLHASVGVLRGELQPICVRFHAPLSRWARRHLWPFPHSLEEESADRVLVRGTVSGLEEIKTELLKWGASAEVLEPSSLRDALRDEARAILARYENPNAQSANATSANATSSTR